MLISNTFFEIYNDTVIKRWFTKVFYTFHLYDKVWGFYEKNFHIKSYSEYAARFASHPWHINENDKEWESMLNCLMNTVVPCPDNFDKLPARRKRIKHSVLIVNADLSQIFILIQKFIKRIPSKWYIRGGRALFQLNDTMYYILTSFYSYKPPRKKYFHGWLLSFNLLLI